MKNLLLVLVLLSSTAYAKDRKSEKIELLKCIRKNVSSRKLNKEIYQSHFNIIESYNGSNAVELTKLCTDLALDMAENKRISHKESIELLFSTFETSEHAYARNSLYLLNSFATNETKCTFRTVKADVVVGFGVGLGIGVGGCEGANGKRWGVIVPSASVHAGLGVFLTVGKDEIYISNESGDEGSLEINFAIILATSINFDNDAQFGVGLGLSLSNTYAYPIKLIRKKDSFNHLLTYLDLIPVAELN